MKSAFKNTARKPVEKNNRQPARRRGGILVVAMVCLVLITLVIGSLLKLTTTQHRQLRYEQRRLQANWLAESALERAADRLADNLEYPGEEWEISANEIGGNFAGRVQITVEPVDGNATERNVRVVAVFPTDTTRFTKRTKQLTIRMNAEP